MKEGKEGKREEGIKCSKWKMQLYAGREFFLHRSDDGLKKRKVVGKTTALIGIAIGKIFLL